MKLRYITSVAVFAMDVACSSDSNFEESSTEGQTTSTQGATGSTEATGGQTSQTSQTTTKPSATTPALPPPAQTEGGGNTGATGGSSPAPETTSDVGDSNVDNSEGEANSATTSPTGPQSSTNETTPGGTDVVDSGADANFSFFVTSYYHMAELSGSEDGFGGDLRYNGATTGLEGADAICQEIARRVGFGSKTWKAYLSTSTVNAIDRIGNGPWYDFLGVKVADSPQDLISGSDRQPGGCCERGTYDELGLFHDGSTDQNNDGIDDDDHDTMTATNEDGTYAGFSCEDWTSTAATSGTTEGGGAGGGGAGGAGGGGRPGGGGGIMMGHSWPANSGQHWATSHAGHQCAAGTNFVQNGGGDSSTVGGGGGYGGFYCFALAE